MRIIKSISFLDVEVIRVGNKLISNWYKIPTSSSKFIGFHTAHPWTQKVASVKAYGYLVSLFRILVYPVKINELLSNLDIKEKCYFKFLYFQFIQFLALSVISYMLEKTKQYLKKRYLKTLRQQLPNTTSP